jgi:hypothetical protein
MWRGATLPDLCGSGVVRHCDGVGVAGSLLLVGLRAARHRANRHNIGAKRGDSGQNELSTTHKAVHTRRNLCDRNDPMSNPLAIQGRVVPVHRIRIQEWCRRVVQHPQNSTAVRSWGPGVAYSHRDHKTSTHKHCDAAMGQRSALADTPTSRTGREGFTGVVDLRLRTGTQGG